MELEVTEQQLTRLLRHATVIMRLYAVDLAQYGEPIILGVGQPVEIVWRKLDEPSVQVSISEVYFEDSGRIFQFGTKPQRLSL